jgi:hypothetical protein
MACVWIEGFETHIGTNQMSRKYASLSGSFTAQAGRVFGSAAGMQSTVAVTPPVASGNTFVIGFGMRFTSHTSTPGEQGLYCELGADEQCHIMVETGSGLGVRWVLKRGTTTIDTSPYVDVAVWHYMELKLTVRTGTNGAYELRHNGVDIMSGTLVNLADTGGDGWDTFAFRFSSNLSTALRFDDMYVLDGTGSKNNDFLGPSVVEGILPTAEGTTIDWTIGSGGSTHWDQVNDLATTPDDTTSGGINHSDTNAQKDLYNYADLANITGTIHAVQVGTQLAMNASGTRTVKTKYRDPDTTEADGASHVVDSTAYDEFTEVFDDNPASAVAWDVTDIDDGQFGVEVVS